MTDLTEDKMSSKGRAGKGKSARPDTMEDMMKAKAKPDNEKTETKPDKESMAEDNMPMDKAGRKAMRKANTFKHFLGGK